MSISVEDGVEMSEKLKTRKACFDNGCFERAGDKFESDAVLRSQGSGLSERFVASRMLKPEKAEEVVEAYVELRRIFTTVGKKNPLCFCCRGDRDVFNVAIDLVVDARKMYYLMVQPERVI